MRTRPLTTLLATAAAGCLALGVLAAPASAAPKQIDYYALGDSYTFGVGNDNRSYADQLDAKRTIDGTKLALPTGGTAATTLPLVNAVPTDADLVTLTVGGNDVGWAETLQACVAVPDACQAAIGVATAKLPTLASDLDVLFTALGDRAPDAKVVVLGYPHLVTVMPGDPMAPLYLAINHATDALNGVIASEAMEAEFVFVDVTERFEGHGVNTDVPWINPYVEGSMDPVPLHPNAKGQQAYYAAVRSTGNLG